MIKITIIGVPTLNNKGLLSDISMHFGRTPYLTTIKIEDNKIKDIDTIEILGKHTGGSKTPAENHIKLRGKCSFMWEFRTESCIHASR